MGAGKAGNAGFLKWEFESNVARIKDNDFSGNANFGYRHIADGRYFQKRNFNVELRGGALLRRPSRTQG
jgi:hypothetical protein